MPCGMCVLSALLTAACVRMCMPPQGHDAQVQALHALYNICKFNKKVRGARMRACVRALRLAPLWPPPPPPPWHHPRLAAPLRALPGAPHAPPPPAPRVHPPAPCAEVPPLVTPRVCVRTHPRPRRRCTWRQPRRRAPSLTCAAWRQRAQPPAQAPLGRATRGAAGAARRNSGGAACAGSWCRWWWAWCHARAGRARSWGRRAGRARCWRCWGSMRWVLGRGVCWGGAGRGGGRRRGRPRALGAGREGGGGVAQALPHAWGGGQQGAPVRTRT